MTRPISAPNVILKPSEERHRGYTLENLPDGILEVQDLTPGLNTAVSREKLQAGTARSLFNARDRTRFFGRRPGHAQFGLTPFSSSVMTIAGVTLTGDRNLVIKYNLGKIEVIEDTGGPWIDVPGDVYDTFLKVSTAQFLDEHFSATLERKILNQKLKGGFTSTEVEQAPIAKFVTAFAERIVSAHIRDPASGLETTRIQWSASADPFVWDALEDLSAGQENLVTSPSDTGDEITGLFAVGQNLAILLRERSIWHITRQPFGIAPFRFTAIITDIGCDMPFSAVRVPGGIIFADTRTNGIYFYAPGSIPQRMNIAIEDNTFPGLVNRDLCEGMWNPIEREYVLGIASSTIERGRLFPMRVFNFDTKGWSTDTNPLPTAIATVRDPGDAISIDELTGTIDGLAPATIDELGGRFATGYVVLKAQGSGTPLTIDELVGTIDGLIGTIDSLGTAGPEGDVIVEDRAVATDPDVAGPFRFEFEYEPIQLSGVRDRRALKELELIMDTDEPADGAGIDVVLATSKNDQAFVNKKTTVDVVAEDRRKVGFKTQTSGDNIRWRVRSTYRNFEIFEWWAKILQKGVKKIDTVQS